MVWNDTFRVFADTLVGYCMQNILADTPKQSTSHYVDPDRLKLGHGLNLLIPSSGLRDPRWNPGTFGCRRNFGLALSTPPYSLGGEPIEEWRIHSAQPN
jgi:hypothetical protein